MHEFDRTSAPPPSPLRIIGSVVVIALALIVLTVAALMLVNYDRADAANYIAVLNRTLSWPAVALAVSLGVLLIFAPHLGALINRIDEFRLPGGAGGTATHRQPALPVDTRPISFTDEEAPSPPETTAEPATDSKHFERERRLLRDEAVQWWHRFLTLFLTDRSIATLTMIKLVSPTSEQIAQWQSAYRAWLMNPTQEDLSPQNSFATYIGRDLEESLPVLLDLELVRRTDDGGLEITDSGRALLEFLDSSEGLSLHRSAEERRGQQEPSDRRGLSSPQSGWR